jgi:glycosyltransferase involved in cell wall biosynthesis
VRILLASNFFPPRRSAGTEMYSLGIARGLARRGHHVEVVCAEGWTTGPRHWNGVSQDTYEGIAVHRIHLNWSKAASPNRSLYQNDRVERWFADFLKQATPDVLHVTSATTLGLGILRAAHRSRLPLVLTLTDFWFMCPRTVLMRSDGQLCDGKTTAWECQRCLLWSSNLFQRLHAWLPEWTEFLLWGGLVCRVPVVARLRGARGLAMDMRHRKASMAEALQWPEVILSPSRVVQTAFASAGLSGRVRHLAHGHDLAWLPPHPRKSASRVLRFGFMGQIAALKGVHTLIAAFCAAGLDGRARLDIWGDLEREPAYTARLREMAACSDGIRFRGPFHRPDLARVLADIDVLVVPSSWYENAPLVIQEAFAMRTPVVATNLGGMAEAVTHGVNGLLFERDDVNDLARQLRRLTDAPDLVRTLAANVPPVKTVDEEIGELEAVYREAIGAVKG